MWQQDTEVNWQERCHELERSLQHFREQATRIRGLLKEKLEELEHRVEDAEKRAKDAEEKGKLMEQRLADSGQSEQSPDLSKIQLECEEKKEVISKLEKQVEEQKKLRVQDAKQVEAKAAKIKEWVTNKLKDLEEQNQHLREQNEKCNEQLELLKNRLVQLGQVNQQSTAKQKDRGSTEDSSRGSYEDDVLPSETPEPSSPTTVKSIELPPDVFTLSESDVNHATYAVVDYSKKKSRIRSTPPRVAIERKKYDFIELDGESSTFVNDIRSELDRRLNFQLDSDQVVIDTMTPLAPHCFPKHVGAQNLINSTGDNHGKPANVDQKKAPVPLPRHRVTTKHVQEGRGSLHSSSSRSGSPASPHVGAKSNQSKSSTATYGSLDRKLAGHRKLVLTEFRGNERRRTAKTDDELHDYAEIYTPSGDIHYPPPLVHHGEEEDDLRPPTPPLHRCPSWESKIYEIAASGINVSSDSLLAATTTTTTMGSPNNLGKCCGEPQSSSGFTDLNIPVYATVKGRASQIRPVPFSGESSDSSDNEDARVTVTTASSHTTSGETESSASTGSPGKGGRTANNASPFPARHSCTSPLKPVTREISSESVLSDDYAIPPDALSTDAFSLDSMEPHSFKTPPVSESPKKERTKDSLEKSGYLTKLGGKFKTWRKRWFVLKNGVLSYYKSENDVNRKPQGQITLNELCRVNRAEGAATFELCTEKRTYYLTADSATTMEEWIRVLQNVLRRHATRLLLSKEENKPTIEGWLTKVKHGHSRRCWCVLIGRMFLYFKTPNDTTPMGQITMRDSRVEEVLHVSDSDEEEEEEMMSRSEFTVGIFPNHQGPTYLLMTSKQEMDAWLYHLTVVSSGENLAGTQYEQLIARLMEVDGDENSVIWRHPLLLYSKENIPQPLTTLPSDLLQAEAVKLFKSIQLFISVPLDTSGIDYHVALAQNALLQCLTAPELQNELFCQLVKQTSRHSSQKLGVQQLLLCATQSLFLCDSSSTERTSPTCTTPPDRSHSAESKLNPAPFVFVQAWQLLALAIPLFVPKNRTLWYLRAHLERNADSSTEPGRYAAFCQRALERALLNSGRECQPSRMEVLSILLKNPFHHCLPHSIPVHFLNGTYQVVGFDGSSTVEEFIQTINAESGIRDCVQSGFALFTDDPIDKELEHCLQNSAKLCDVISKWEQALREGHLGKFETTKVVKLTYKNRLCFHQLLKAETDKERLLTAYHVNEEVVQSRFPLSPDLALELAALMAQIEFGDFDGEKARGSGVPHGNPEYQLQQVVDRFFSQRYKDAMTEKQLQETIRDKWVTLKGRTVLDCVRIYLNCARKWPLCGAKLFSSKLKTGDQSTVWIAVTEDSLVLLDFLSMQPIIRYPYSAVMTFGGCRDDFMLVVSQSEIENNKEGGTTERLLFSMPKPKILDITLLIADYMNAMGRAPTVPPSPQASTLSRLEKIRAKIRATTARTGTGSTVRSELAPSDSPDLVKMTAEADIRLQRADGKKRIGLETT